MGKLFMLFFPLLIYAGTVGKIAGRVLDAETNEPLVAVDVFIDELQTGGATDMDGHYFILNVPPGTYDVEASMIGYRAEIKKSVNVFTDRTTYIDFTLSPTVIELDAPVVVVAKRPVIEIDMTSKETRITREQFDITPIEKPTEAIALQGGVTTDAAGELHVRGGRSGELAYYIEGIEVSNALLGNAPVLNKNLISEMSLLSGTFNAEYGNIMSGVVNIITPEGGSKISTKLEYTSFVLNPSPYRKKDWISALDPYDPDYYDAHRSLVDSLDTVTVSDYEVPDLLGSKDLPFLGGINASAEGPIPGDRATRFFIAGNYLNEESYLPFGYNLSRSVNGKLTRRFGPNLKLLLDAQYIDEESQNYHHLYKYLSENYLVTYEKSIRGIIGFNHAPVHNFFYNIRFGYIQDKLETKVPTDTGSIFGSIGEPIRDNFSEFYLSGYPQFRQEVKTTQYVAKADFNWQLGKIHNLKFGGEQSFYDFELTNRQQLFTRTPIIYQNYVQKPRDGAIFIQDKIEHKYLVVNAGVRFDYSRVNTVMWEDIEDPTSAVTDVKTQYQISPRLGLSHPITDDAMLHFAYGHFFQMPPYEIMYFNSSYIASPESIPRYGLVGNPSILPQRTTAYEVGVKYAIRDMYGIDVTLFLKDIKNLLSTTEVRLYPYNYIIYTNDDFGSVQGIDVTFKRDLVDNLGFNFNYTYQVARGNRSFAMQGFYDVYTGSPERKKEYYLDFDRRHTFSGTFQYQFNELGGIGINAQLASGLPYTPYIGLGVVVEENSGRMEWGYSIDLLLHQGVRFGRTLLVFFVSGTNLTDAENPRYVYPRTGLPWDAGEEGGGLMGSPDYIIDPSNIGRRRSIKAGIRVTVS
ncbi:MAG: TonB-dependent receptor [candidate division WOR-3 bacterium]|nr:MAG: TonB-dependent receptor [candidate division WOR-3 bacterium]